MGIIKQLPPHEIHKIAAGEVIERPANVIKELVENALDAGACSITVYAEEGGKTLMRVIDDGGGMSLEDARMCIVHHATSKLKTVDDLEHLRTFGFRGEALSSIAAVSRMQIITREISQSIGNKLTIAGGKIIAEEQIATNSGTDITIQDLFYSVPARKKFLKTDDTEWRVLFQLLQAFALSYPACSFTLYHNRKMVLQCRPAENLLERMNELYASPITDALLACVKQDTADFTIEGLITNPHVMRYDRNQIYIFVNKRWIKNTKLSHAFLKGYAGVLQPMRYPVGAISITIDTTQVDINIHPRKEEIHFLHPRRVESALEVMVKMTLENYTTGHTQISSVTNENASSFTGLALQNFQHGSINTTKPQPTFFKSGSQSIERHTTKELLASSADIPLKPAREAFVQVLESAFSPPTSDIQYVLQTEKEGTLNVTRTDVSEDYTLIGQLLKTYIVIENREGLVLIDQHAAHERILYELLAHHFNEIAVVPLLFPAIITFHEIEAELLESNNELFSQYGLILNRISLNQCAVQSAPVMLKNVSYEDILKEMLVVIQEGGDSSVLQSKMHHALRAQMACKAAVKAGDVLGSEEMHELIKLLNKAPNRFSCPHGRPTSWPITLSEIERKFKRKL